MWEDFTFLNKESVWLLQADNSDPSWEEAKDQGYFMDTISEINVKCMINFQVQKKLIYYI